LVGHSEFSCLTFSIKGIV